MSGDCVRKSYFAAVLIFCFCLLLSACGSNEIHEIRTPETLEDVLAIALARRQALERPDYDRITQLTKGRAPVPEKYIVPLRDGLHGPPGRVITVEHDADDILYDIEVFFSVLAGIYALYTYWGGDDVFLPLRDEMIETINTQPVWSRVELAQLFYTKLSGVITDNHFSIPQLSGLPFTFGGYYEFFDSNERFDRSTAGFVNQANGLHVQQLLLPCRPDIVLDGEDIFRMAILPEGFFQEGMGIAPDIWVAGCALEAALSMIDTHLFRGES